MTTWILVCDASDARLYSTVKGIDSLTFLREIPNAAGRLKGPELRSDKPGRIRSRGATNHVSAIDPHTEAQEVEAVRFAKELAEMLYTGQRRGDYDGLTIAAPPHFLGLLRNELDPAVARRVRNAIDKDLTHLTAARLRQHLQQETVPGQFLDTPPQNKGPRRPKPVGTHR